MDLLKEIWALLRKKKRLWLFPLIILMLLIGGLLVVAQGSILAPFIYALF